LLDRVNDRALEHVPRVVFQIRDQFGRVLFGPGNGAFVDEIYRYTNPDLGPAAGTCDSPWPSEGRASPCATGCLPRFARAYRLGTSPIANALEIGAIAVSIYAGGALYKCETLRATSRRVN
jgi:hypothetical protein